MVNEKPKRKNRPGQGRPFKMKIWIEKLEEVLMENDVVFLTDEDLVFLVNEKIDDPTQQITPRTLRNWKTGKAPDEETGKAFTTLIRKALIKQKQALLTKMLSTEDRSWPKYSWILERRFSEWNLKTISEIKHTSDQPVIQIQAANDQQKQLIENIINADFEEIEPLKLDAPLNDNEDEENEF